MLKILVISQVEQLDTPWLEGLVKALNLQADELLRINGFSGKYFLAKNGQDLSGYAPLYIQKEIDEDLNGYHWVDQRGNPYAKVKYKKDRDALSLTISHEGIEMIANPKIDKFKDATGFLNEPNQDAKFVFEIADITQSKDYAYRQNGYLLSNFVTLNWYDALKSKNIKYDYLGHCTEPRQLLEGGYKSIQLTDKRDLNKTEYLQAFKQKGVLIWRKMTGESVTNSINENTFAWILGITIIVIITYIKLKKQTK